MDKANCNEIIPLAKAEKWLWKQIYAGFDSINMSFNSTTECVEQFLKDMRDPNFGIEKKDDWYDDDWY